jgi:hypothetical protein
MHPIPTAIHVTQNGDRWHWSVDYHDPALSRSGDADTFDEAMLAVVDVVGEME